LIGLDTNVLARYLVRDDPSQLAAATRLIERRLTEHEPGFVSGVVLAELSWVLGRSYRWSAARVAAAMEVLVDAEVLVVEHEGAAAEAIAMVRDGRGEFADAFIAAIAEQAGCSQTLTFDRGALHLPGFALV
jgi:predicted nucleic-acid-binding protein